MNSYNQHLVSPFFLCRYQVDIRCPENLMQFQDRSFNSSLLVNVLNDEVRELLYKDCKLSVAVLVPGEFPNLDFAVNMAGQLISKPDIRTSKYGNIFVKGQVGLITGQHMGYVIQGTYIPSCMNVS